MNSRWTKIAVYTRVSTKEQNNNTSLESQKDAINRYIEKKPELQQYTRVEYEETHSASLNPKGDEVVRSELKRLLRDVYSEEFAYVICYSHDRFTRNIDEFVIIQQTMKLLGIKVLYAKAGEDINTENDSLNKLFENLMNNLATLEANIISSRVKMANKYKAKHGIWNGGKPPYGYRLIPHLENPKQTILCVNEVEAGIIREIFELYTKGYNNHDIALYVRETYYNNNDRMWTHNTIKNILKNPAYTGVGAWNKKGGMRNPVRNPKEEYIYSPLNPQNVIVSKELWEKAENIRNILENNSKFISTEFTIKNFACCGECGKTLKGKNHGYGKRFYYCEDGHMSIKASVLDSNVIEEISLVMERILTLDDKFKSFYTAYVEKLERLNNDIQIYVEKIKSEIDLNRKVKISSLEKVSEMEETIRMTGEDYSELLNALREQMIKWDILNEQLEEEISHKAPFKIPTFEEFKELIESNKNEVMDIIKSVDVDHRKRALRVLFSQILYKVVVNDAFDVEIIFK